MTFNLGVSGLGLSPLFPKFSPLFYSSIPTILIITPIGLLHYSHKRQIIPAYKVINRQLYNNNNYYNCDNTPFDGNFLATRVAKKLSRGHAEFFSWELALPMRGVTDWGSKVPRPLDDLRLALGRAGLLTILRFLVSSVFYGQRNVSRLEGRGGPCLLPEKIRSQVG